MEFRISWSSETFAPVVFDPVISSPAHSSHPDPSILFHNFELMYCPALSLTVCGVPDSPGSSLLSVQRLLSASLCLLFLQLTYLSSDILYLLCFMFCYFFHR